MGGNVECARAQRRFSEAGPKIKHIRYEDVALEIANYSKDIELNKLTAAELYIRM